MMLAHDAAIKQAMLAELAKLERIQQTRKDAEEAEFAKKTMQFQAEQKQRKLELEQQQNYEHEWSQVCRKMAQKLNENTYDAAIEQAKSKKKLEEENAKKKENEELGRQMDAVFGNITTPPKEQCLFFGSFSLKKFFP
jgi:hypothetical protein